MSNAPEISPFTSKLKILDQFALKGQLPDKLAHRLPDVDDEQQILDAAIALFGRELQAIVNNGIPEGQPGYAYAMKCRKIAASRSAISERLRNVSSPQKSTNENHPGKEEKATTPTVSLKRKDDPPGRETGGYTPQPL